MFAPADYHFELPSELIAQHPLEDRDGSRLLAVGPPLEHRAFRDLATLLPANAVLVVNDTRVIPARIFGAKPTGGQVELLLLEPEPAAPSTWRALARGAVKPGMAITVGGGGRAVVLTIRSERDPSDQTLLVDVPGDALALLERHGHMPLPPYIERAAGADDNHRYQTMFARAPGAVAAPTAGLHMTPAIAAELTARGVAIATVTLHVGWGTFAPIRVSDVRDHKMHRERYSIPAPTAALIASGRPVVALGTTSLRALEAAAIAPRQVAVGDGTTDLFIHPGSDHRFAIVDHLITNFHLPESTLLMLVCAFGGSARVLAAYRAAVAARYRFFSYGDAMWLTRSAL